MKYSSTIYAKAFAETAAEHRGAAEEAKFIQNFLAIIRKNGDAPQIKKIVAETEKSFREKIGGRKITIETARETKKFPHKFLKHFLKTGDAVEEKINPDLVAGMKITINDTEQFDGSLKRKIDKLFS